MGVHADTSPLLEINNLCVDYLLDQSRDGKERLRAVDHVDLRVREGESLGIVGESGSGKSTLAKAILRLLPTNGRVSGGETLYKGRNIYALTREEFRRLRWAELAVVFQQAMNSLSPVHTIEQHLVDIYRVHNPGASRDEVRERGLELLSVVGLDKQALQSYAHELSGGMLQRTMIMLSLICAPSLLILDESTTALDVITQNQILDEISRLKEQFGLTTVIISHDISTVSETVDRVAIMYGGRLMEVGSVDQVLRKGVHPYSRALVHSFPYLGDTRQRIEGIPGAPPDLTKEHSGCIFVERCLDKREICHQEVPPRVDVQSEHYAFCHYPVVCQREVQ